MGTVNQSDSDTATLDDNTILRGGFTDTATLSEASTFPHTVTPHTADESHLTETEYIAKYRNGVWLAPYVGPGIVDPYQPEGVAGTYPGTTTQPSERV